MTLQGQISMVIDNGDVFRPRVSPSEYDTPLLVDADGMELG